MDYFCSFEFDFSKKSVRFLDVYPDFDSCKMMVDSMNNFRGDDCPVVFKVRRLNENEYSNRLTLSFNYLISCGAIN